MIPTDLIEARDRLAAPTLEKIRQDQKRSTGKVRRMLQVLEQDLFASELNVDILRQRADTRDRSSISFKSSTGTPPKHYISDRRLEVAARLLTSTDFKVWQIVDAVGFSSLGVFSKAFHRWAGMRPRAYRKQRSSTEALRPVDAEFLRRAVSGALTVDEASWLVGRLREPYPFAEKIYHFNT